MPNVQEKTELTPLVLEEFDEDTTEKTHIKNTEKKILILKKNPLEAQILSKVISNLNYDIEIVNQVKQLETYIQKEKYDILLIDKEIEQFNQKILEKQHESMNVIILSPIKPSNEYYNTNLIKEVHVGIIKRDKIEQLIKKYRR
jgi:DNA-binding response OmpR family regulator